MLKRILSVIPTLFVIITITFFLVRVAPGGPFDSDKKVSPEILANIQKAYHLDEPLYKQYLNYMGNLLKGDLGPSFKYPDRTVNEMIAYSFPTSMKIGLASLLIGVTLGGLIGAIAAIKQNGFADYSIMTFAMIGITIPGFIMAPLLILIFGVYLGWLPAGGWGDNYKQIILPIAILALPQIAVIARLMRGSMIEVLNSNYIRTARAKGLGETKIVLKHCLKPALLPLVSYLGPAIAGVLTGSVVVENIFGIPGMGRYFVDGALQRDYTLVLGVVIFYGVLIMVLNLIVDLFYALLDPKVRLG